MSRAGPGDVIMNDTNSEGCGWLAGHRQSEESAQLRTDRVRNLRRSLRKKKINSHPAFPIDGRALQTRPPRHDPPLFQPLSGHRAPAPGGA